MALPDLKTIGWVQERSEKPFGHLAKIPYPDISVEHALSPPLGFRTEHDIGVGLSPQEGSDRRSVGGTLKSKVSYCLSGDAKLGTDSVLRILALALPSPTTLNPKP